VASLLARVSEQETRVAGDATMRADSECLRTRSRVILSSTVAALMPGAGPTTGVFAAPVPAPSACA
jgi:hypothetical protein